MYKLIPTRYDGQIELGGSTKPWKVWAINEANLETNIEPNETPYVVKLFSKSTLDQHPCIAKEFICNKLADEFDLFVPPSGIINLNSPDFLATLTKKDINVLNQKFKGDTYASMLLNGPMVNEKINDSFSTIEDKANIYAFDCLILNIDRWGIHKKPNLIIYDERYMLIDHELSLSFIDRDNDKTLQIILDGFAGNKLVYNYKSHLFYQTLKTFKEDKSSIFNTFQEYLINLNIYKIRVLVDELESNDVSVGSVNLLFRYLNEIKKLSNEFCSALVSSIS